MTIPKILHQVWFQFGPDKPSTPPAEYDAMRQSWRDFHPDWEIKLWNKEMALQLINDHFPEVLPVFLGYPKEIQRVDAIRYMILAHQGGFYVDCDTKCLASLEPLVSQSVVLVKDITPWLGLNNGFIGSIPNHQLMIRCTRNLYRSAKVSDPIISTGPIFLTSNWLTDNHKNEILILNVKELKRYFLHHHFASWCGISQWRQALNPERRQFMKIDDVPCILRPFLKGKVGAALSV